MKAQQRKPTASTKKNIDEPARATNSPKRPRPTRASQSAMAAFRKSFSDYIHRDTEWVVAVQRFFGVHWINCEDPVTGVKYHEYTRGNIFLHGLFSLGAALGTEAFYILFLPILAWWLNLMVARRVVVVWVLVYYIGQLLKDLLKLPRPYAPPAVQLEKHYADEYGMPSTHAMCAFSFPFYFAYLLTGADLGITLTGPLTLDSILAHSSALVGKVSIFDSVVAVGANDTLGITSSLSPLIIVDGWKFSVWSIAIFWCVIMTLSRLYMGVHSFADLTGGIILGLSILYFVIMIGDDLDHFLLTAPWISFWIIVLGIFMTLLYYYVAQPDKWTPTFGDTCIVLGVGMIGNVLGVRWSLPTPITNPIILDALMSGYVYDNDINNIAHLHLHNALAEAKSNPNYIPPSFKTFTDPMPLLTRDCTLASPALWLLCRCVVGYGMLFVVRLITKEGLWKIMSWITPARPELANQRHRYDAEIPVKLITYATLGLFGGVTCPILFKLFGL